MDPKKYQDIILTPIMKAISTAPIIETESFENISLLESYWVDIEDKEGIFDIREKTLALWDLLLPYKYMAPKLIKRDYEYIKKWEVNIRTIIWDSYLANSNIQRYKFSRILNHIQK